MLHKRKHIIILIAFVAIIGILSCIYIVQYQNAFKIIKNKINLTIPPASKTIHFNYDSWSGGFDAKIQINGQEVERLRKNLIKCLGKEYIVKSISDLPYIATRLHVKRDNIVVYYMGLREGEKHWILPGPKTTSVWAFIVKLNDGKYYLYISST